MSRLMDNDEIKREIKTYKMEEGVSTKSRMVAFLLCYIFGLFGAHRFYVGKNFTAVLYIFTFGLFGVGLLVDLLQIILGKFKTSSYEVVKKWFED